MVGMGAPEVAELNYEQARDELARVISELEQGTPTLEHSLELWERGEALARRCEEWLVGARERLNAARSGAIVSTATATGDAATAHNAPTAHNNAVATHTATIDEVGSA